MKHLIYLIDGTWLFAGELTYENSYTNVFQLADRICFSDKAHRLQRGEIDDGNPQVIHYVRGIGSTKGIRRISAGGFGFAIDETIQDIYVNICANFTEGDKVYLVGFSRGAIIARAVCELLDFGLLNASEVRRIDRLWSMFIAGSRPRRKSDADIPDAIDTQDLPRECFNSGFNRVEFLGLFDSVIGGARISKRMQYLRRVSDFVPRCVQHAFQIHALDETRPFFLPQPYRGKRLGGNTERSLEQVWIPGVHADVGGGYDNSTLSDVSLLLMIDRIIHHTDLKIGYMDLKEYLTQQGGLKPRIHNEYASLKWFWCAPFARGRKIDNFRNYLHPIAKELCQVPTKYKHTHPTEYTLRRGSELQPASYFKSNDLANRRIKWAGN